MESQLIGYTNCKHTIKCQKIVSKSYASFGFSKFGHFFLILKNFHNLNYISFFEIDNAKNDDGPFINLSDQDECVECPSGNHYCVGNIYPFWTQSFLPVFVLIYEAHVNYLTHQINIAYDLYPTLILSQSQYRYRNTGIT